MISNSISVRRESPPDHGVPRRRVVGAVEIASEAGELDDLVAKPASMNFIRPRGHQFVQQILIKLRE
jgi:hypothetical protein